MQYNIRIEGLDRLRERLGDSMSIVYPHIVNAIQKSTETIRDKTKDIIITGTGYSKRPYWTGFMHDHTIFQMVSSLTGEVMFGGRASQYAIFPHEGLGTSKKYGRRPFLEDALKDKWDKIEQIFNDEIEQALQEIVK